MPHDFEASVEIAAPAEVVWEVLVDLPRYGEWNTFCPGVESTLVVGSPAILHVRMNEKKNVVQREIVIANDSVAMKLCWGTKIGAAFIMSAERWQFVEPLGPGRSRYHTHESFQGLLAGFVRAVYGKDVQRGFDNMARNLKDRAESLSS